MRTRLWMGAVVLGAAGALLCAEAASPASPPCSQATATRVGAPYAFDPAAPKVALELCGPFLGPGSEAMAVAFVSPTCWPFQSWALFGFEGDVWKLVRRIPSYLAPGKHLVAIGGDIRETTTVHRAGDPRCLPSGGTRARVWHWNGKALVAGPWKQVEPPATPPPPPPAVGGFTYGSFKTPSGNIQCDYGYGGNARAYVRCGVRSGLKPTPPSRGPGCDQRPWVTMRPTGRAVLGPSICPGEDEGDPGPFTDPTAKSLGYGQSWSAAGLRCTSAFAGLTCRNRSGHGWFLSRARYRLL